MPRWTASGEYVRETARSSRSRAWLVVMALVMVFALVAAACGGDDDDSSGATGTTLKGQKENTGKVNLMSAGEPEEVQAYQTIFDDLINCLLYTSPSPRDS